MNKDPNVELKNADVNFNQYGDDSSAPNQATAGGMNEKYIWEWTKNSNIAYNKDIRIADLDPEYKYGWDAQVANSAEEWYIARRNDNIASALYNEWKRSQEEVASFLANQKWWMNGTSEDRINTVNSIWKRIWDIQEQEDKNNTELEVKADEAEKKEEPKGKDVNVNTFLQGTSTELFWKMITWADTAPYDHESNEWKKAEARLKQYEMVNSLTVEQLASSISWGSILSGGQAMRDLQTYNPEKYQQLQEYQKKQETMDQVNMISTWNFTNTEKTLQEKTWESVNNYLNETVANAGGDNIARMDLDSTLSQNQWLINYAERMSYYSSKITELDQTIWDLEADARKRLGADVPEYMIQNYVNNRSKKLYKQRDNLMNQYNYYKWVYEAQVEAEATERERGYKERQLALQENKALWDQTMDMNNYNLKERQQIWNEQMDKKNYSLKERQQDRSEHMDLSNMDYKQDQMNYNYYKLNSQNPVWDTALQGWVSSFVDSIQNKINSHAKIRTWWCGTVVNDYLKSLGINFSYDDKKSTKLNSITPWAWPKVWSIAVWDKTGTTDGDKYWHVAIVTDVNNKNGTITVLESNKNTWLRYHTYKQANVTWYYDPSAWSKKTTTTKTTTTKKEDKKYTNDELYTQLRGGKIKYSDFLKNWNGDEPQEEIDKWVGKTYFEKSPMMHISNMKDSVNALGKMLWDDVLAETYTLDHLNGNKNISSDNVVKIVNNYVTETNQWLKDADKINLAEYLSLALDGRYTTQDELKKALKAQWVKDYKKVSKEIMNIWNG